MLKGLQVLSCSAQNKDSLDLLLERMNFQENILKSCDMAILPMLILHMVMDNSVKDKI